jgi:hypothetical protein
MRQSFELDSTSPRQSEVQIDAAEAVAGMRKWEKLDLQQIAPHLGYVADFSVFNRSFDQRLYGKPSQYYL